jgi:protein MpaA
VVREAAGGWKRRFFAVLPAWTLLAASGNIWRTVQASQIRTPSMWINREDRGCLVRQQVEYGRTRGGLSLVYVPADVRTGLLVHASIHGTEPDALTTVSAALRMVPAGKLRADVILALNPEGILRGTRCNDAGVELNRNFPEGWQGGKIGSRWTPESPRDTWLVSGTAPLSEPETQALVDLHDQRQITHTVSVHGPLGCVEDPTGHTFSRELAEGLALPLIADVGHPTPGCFGDWARSTGRVCATVELPTLAVPELVRDYAERMAGLLAGHFAAPAEHPREAQ